LSSCAIKPASTSFFMWKSRCPPFRLVINAIFEKLFFPSNMLIRILSLAGLANGSSTPSTNRSMFNSSSFLSSLFSTSVIVWKARLSRRSFFWSFLWQTSQVVSLAFWITCSMLAIFVAKSLIVSSIFRVLIVCRFSVAICLNRSRHLSWFLHWVSGIFCRSSSSSSWSCAAYSIRRFWVRASSTDFIFSFSIELSSLFSSVRKFLISCFSSCRAFVISCGGWWFCVCCPLRLVYFCYLKLYKNI